MKLIHIPKTIKDSHKVIGYFSYTDESHVFCDGDACIIAGSEDIMKSYLQRMPNGSGRDIIKKTRFGEIIEGLRRGGAYAFDEEAYAIFSHHANNNGIDCALGKDLFTDSEHSMHFIRLQIV